MNAVTKILVTSVGTAVVGVAWATQAGARTAVPTLDDARAERAAGADEGLLHAYERVAESIRPSVVSITSSREVRLPADVNPFLGLLGQTHPFLQESPFLRDEPRPQRERGLGSGLVLRADGYVLTNNHVVAGADELEVQLADRRTLPAKVVGIDERTDLAVVKVDANDLVPARLADSDAVHVGQWVAAFGAPFGLEQTISAGIVSAKGRANLHLADYEDFLQTDAAINPGNSGGPLCDLDGRVIGIDTAIATRTGQSAGVGFAIPANLARSIADRLIEDGKVVRGWLGVAIQDLTPDLARSFGGEAGHGVVVADVTAGSPAEKAGLEAGDVLTTLDGRALESSNALRNLVAGVRPGTQVELGVLRRGEKRTLTAQVATLEERAGDTPAGASERHGFGLELADPETAMRHGIAVDEGDGAVIVDVRPGSVAEHAGLRPGDVIVEVDRKAVHHADDAVKALAAQREHGCLLRVRRDGVAQWVELGAAR